MEQIGENLETMPRVPLADEHVACLRELGTERTYDKGAMVAEAGEAMERFVYVLDGEIEVVDPFSGERLLDSSLGPTQFMGEISFLNAGSHTLPMRAAKDTRTLEVPREDMLDLMSRIPELSDHVLSVFAARRRKQFEGNNSAIKLIGADQDSAVQSVERFLSRNRVPFQTLDLDGDDDEALEACRLVEHRPAVILGQDRVIDDPSPRKMAQYLGLDMDVCRETVYDLLIVGAGPAGVAAAVYAGSEGLQALVVEDTAIGGQAGTSSRIENYMGFPTGISGADLVYRGQIQAMKFATRFAMPRQVCGLVRREDGTFCADLDDGDKMCAKTVLCPDRRRCGTQFSLRDQRRRDLRRGRCTRRVGQTGRQCRRRRLGRGQPDLELCRRPFEGAARRISGARRRSSREFRCAAREMEKPYCVTTITRDEKVAAPTKTPGSRLIAARGLSSPTL